VVLIVTALTIFVYFQIALSEFDERKKFNEVATGYYSPSIQLFSILILTSSIVTLLVLLRKQEKLVMKSSNGLS